ncbi:MAG TPA: tetratricopeptide repeat protein [Gammaproteobacteria bacterium]|nr:tetratricopeptide repeat protein [Gammaproteobacteria bacterium]
MKTPSMREPLRPLPNIARTRRGCSATICRQRMHGRQRNRHLSMNTASRLLQAGRVREARDHLLELCRQRPQDAGNWYLLGCAHERLAEPGEASNALARAIALQPGHRNAWRAHARVLEALGKDDAALAAYRRLGELDPGSSAFVAGCIARIHERNGRHETAWRTIEPLIAAGQGNVDVALVYARLCKHTGQYRNAIAYLSQGIAHPAVSKPDRTRMRFHLGALHEALGEYDLAFECIAQANRDKGVHFDIDAHEAQLQRVIEVFSANRLQRMPRSSNTSSKPVFIVGMPRSGTTLVEQILASHPQVHGGGELPWIPRTVSNLAGTEGPVTPYLHAIADLSAPQVDATATEYLERLTKLAPTAERITDKQMLNFLNLGLIALMFPRARVIHCTREPMDTCLSCYFLEFAEANEFTYELATLGRFHRQHERLMDHWKSVLDLSLMEVRYEELVTQQEATTRALLDFLDLQWDERCLRFHESRRQANTASYEQVRQPMYTGSVGRWKNYERHLGPLKAALGQGGCS